jgi:hypothetical protein
MPKDWQLSTRPGRRLSTPDILKADQAYLALADRKGRTPDLFWAGRCGDRRWGVSMARAQIVWRGRSVAFRMAEVMVPQALFCQILDAVAALRSVPPAAQC